MTLDLLIAVTATASAAVVIAALTLSAPASPAERVGATGVLIAWFLVAVILAATGAVAPDGFGTPVVGLSVLVPIVAGALLAARSELVRNALYGIPLPVFVAVNALRVFGVFFLILYADGRLPAPFAPSAGWGDIAVGVAAVPVALVVARQAAGWRPLAFVWNLVGIADLALAVGLGVTSAVDSPLRIFADGPDTSLMAALPMFLIPGFLVPFFVLTHLAVFVRLARAGKRAPAFARV
jgi:hypothetical protein